MKKIPKNKYLKLELNEIKEGDMFFVTLYSIQGFNIVPEQYDEELKDFQYDFFCTNFETLFEEFENHALLQSIINNSITLVKYLGDGKFLEYYKGIIINYIDFGKEEDYINYIDFMDDYNNYIKNPLYIEYGRLLPIDNINLRYQFVEQKENENYISDILYNMQRDCINNLQKGLKKIAEQDQTYAYAENMIRTFAKTEPKK